MPDAIVCATRICALNGNSSTEPQNRCPVELFRFSLSAKTNRTHACEPRLVIQRPGGPHTVLAQAAVVCASRPLSKSSNDSTINAPTCASRHSRAFIESGFQSVPDSGAARTRGPVWWSQVSRAAGTASASCSTDHIPPSRSGLGLTRSVRRERRKSRQGCVEVLLRFRR